MFTLALNANSASYIKFDGVDGESTDKKTETRATVNAEVKTRGDGSDDDTQSTRTTTSDSSETKAQLELQKTSDDEEKKKGNVEYSWKVEEGTKFEGVGIEPDEIDFMGEEQSNVPDFGILLGGGNEEGDEESREELKNILLSALKEEMPAETLSLNYEKITFKVKQSVKILGFIPVETSATIDVDASAKTKVKFPWWSFLATNKNSDKLSEKTIMVLSSVAESRHDTAKISN